MLKRIFKYLIALSVVCVTIAMTYDYYDSFDVHKFRRVDQPLNVAENEPLPNTTGFDTLYISGGKRQSPKGVRALLKDVKMPIYVFDLQGDDHRYINGSLPAWYGYTSEEEVALGKDRLSFRHFVRRIVYTGKLHHTDEDMETEEQAQANAGMKYLHIPVTRRTIPTAEQVDEYIRLVNALPQPCWIHFQCVNGKNRTSVGMMMYDILKNGKNLSMEDIGRRHALLGSENIFDTEVRPNSTYSKKSLGTRLNFLIAFHRFVNDPEGYGKSTWQAWADKHNIYDGFIFA